MWFDTPSISDYYHTVTFDFENYWASCGMWTLWDRHTAKSCPGPFSAKHCIHWRDLCCRLQRTRHVIGPSTRPRLWVFWYGHRIQGISGCQKHLFTFCFTIRERRVLVTACCLTLKVGKQSCVVLSTLNSDLASGFQHFTQCLPWKLSVLFKW